MEGGKRSLDSLRSAAALEAGSSLGPADLPKRLQLMSLKESQPTDQSMANTTVVSFANGDHRSKQILVRGISSTVTNDHLTNFLELMCLPDQCSVVDVKKGSKHGVAVIILSSGVDLSELQNVCREHPLENDTVLTVDLVDERGTIVVRNPHCDTRTDSFLYFFRNARNGGEKIARVERDPDNKYLIVYFSSTKVAHDVANKSHQLEGRPLDVVAFDINLDQLPLTSGTNASCPLGNIGGSSHTDSTCRGITSGVGGLSLSADLDHHRDRQPEPPPKVIAHFEGLHMVYLGVLDAFSEMIPRVMEDITVDVKDDIVELTGPEFNVKHSHSLLQNLIKKQKESPFLHSVPGSFGGWERIFEEMEEEIGMRESEPQYLLLFREAMTPSGTLEEELFVCTQDNQSLTFDEFLQKFVSSREELVKLSAQKDRLCSTAWDQFMGEDFFNEFKNSVIATKDEEGNKVTLFGSVRHLAGAANSVCNFLENVPAIECLRVSSTQQRFLRRFQSEELITIQQCCAGLEEVNINIEKNTLNIQGSRQGVNHAVRSLNKILESLLCSRAVYSAKFLSRIVGKQEWDEMLQMVGDEYRCIISNLPDVSVGDADTDREEWGQWAATVVHSFFLSDAECHIVEGDVTVMKVDAIVMCQESCTSVLPSNPPTNRSTPQSTGARLKINSQSRSKEATSTTCGLTVRQPGALPCKAVILVDLQRYLKSDAENWLNILMSDILQEAVDKGYSSLAVPVLGVDGFTGQQVLPIDVATSVIVQSIRRKSQVHGKESHLKSICLCSNRAACIRGFIDAFENQDLTPRPPTSGSYRLLGLEQAKSPGKPLNIGKIQIVKANVADIKTRVVVVPLDDDLDVSKNKVSRALQSCGGPSQYNLTHRPSFWPFRKKMDPDDWEEKFAEERFLEGSCGTWNAANIFYLHLPPWGPGVKEIMTNLLRRCLLEANKMSSKSLTLTALGVGRLGYPVEFSAHTMLAVISDYLERNQCCVDCVQIVIFPTDLKTYNVFSELHQKAVFLSREVNSSQQLSYPPHPSTPTYVETSSHRGMGGSRRGRGRGAGRQSHSPSTSGIHRLQHGNPYSTNKKYFSCGNIKLRVKEGNIVHEDCDIIVNSTNEHFDLSKGGVSKALVKHCGDELVRTCRKEGTKKKMKNKGFVLTPAPNLGNKKILHVDLNKFKSKPIETLKKCLEITRDHTCQLQSIAFPAFGTGDGAKGGVFASMATALVKAVGEFKTNGSVNDVRLVLSSPEQLQQMSQSIEDMLDPKQSTQKGKEQANGRAAQEKENSSLPASTVSGKSTVVKKLFPRPNYHDPDAVSVYICSDNPYDRHAAEQELASRIENMLFCHGYIEAQTNQAPRDGGGRSHGQNSRGADGDRDYKQSLVYPHPHTYFSSCY